MFNDDCNDQDFIRSCSYVIT